MTGYTIFRNGTAIATHRRDHRLLRHDGGARTRTYTYDVRAMDGAGNLSDPSNSAPVTTPACGHGR